MQVAASRDFSAALKADGTLWTWAATTWASLASAIRTRRTTPAQVPLTDVAEIAAGDSFMLARLKDGRLYAWGDNSYGQIDGAEEEFVCEPFLLEGFENVRSVRAGNNHALVLMEDGSLRVWGDDYYGQFGGGDEALNAFLEENDLAVTAIEAGGDMCALRDEGGEWYLWGAISLATRPRLWSARAWPAFRWATGTRWPRKRTARSGPRRQHPLPTRLPLQRHASQLGGTALQPGRGGTRFPRPHRARQGPAPWSRSRARSDPWRRDITPPSPLMQAAESGPGPQRLRSTRPGDEEGREVPERLALKASPRWQRATITRFSARTTARSTARVAATTMTQLGHGPLRERERTCVHHGRRGARLGRARHLRRVGYGGAASGSGARTTSGKLGLGHTDAVDGPTAPFP